MAHSFGPEERQYWTVPLHPEQACLSSLLGDICLFDLGANESAADSHHKKRDRLLCYHSFDLNTLQTFAKDRGLDADGDKAKLCLILENAEKIATLHHFPEFAPELRTEIYNANFACLEHITLDLDLNIELYDVDGDREFGMGLTCKTKFYKRATTILGEEVLRNRYSDLLCQAMEVLEGKGWNVGYFMAFLEFARTFLEKECRRCRKRLTHDGRYKLNEVY